MTAVGKALWFIESHFADDITLDDVAQASGVSRFHLSRAFGEATGRSVMRYVRGRRLSDAAKTLAAGAPDILAVALDAGYGSHEAFTRAFRDAFGLTPDALRAQGHLDNAPLTRPMRLTMTSATALAEPRIETGKTLLLAGLSQYLTFEACAGIPALWQCFAPYIGAVPGQLGAVTYGVRSNFDENGLDYMPAVEVRSFEGVPAELTRLRLAAQTYAVFFHAGHVSTVSQTIAAIWDDWLPRSGRAFADAPDFERYTERFDPRTGDGGVEIWVPLQV